MRKWAADAALLGVAFVWGATFVLVQKAIAKLPPFSFLAVRFTLAALCLWAIGRLLGQKARADRRSLAAGAVLGVWLFGGYALQTLGLLWTTPARAGFITGLSVVLVPLFSWLILHHRPTVPAWAGAGLAAAGLYLLTGAGEEIFRLFKDGSSAELAALSIAGSAWNRGDTLVLMCALCFALQIICTGRYAPRHNALVLAVVQIATVAVLSFAAAWVWENPAHLVSPSVWGNRDVWLALLITAVPATALAFWAQTAFQRYTTPAHVALIFATEPLFAALTSYWWTGEELGPLALVGGALIFAGMVLAEWPTRPHTPKAASAQPPS
ncbi:MAG: DMT family transporter [Bacillota bacterium]|nr:EamA family transporter [Bacillota bacterium]